MSDVVKQHQSESAGRERMRPRARTAALAAIACVFGLLLWAKLLLVTGHPRTALADPDDKAEPAPAAPDQSAPQVAGAESR